MTRTQKESEAHGAIALVVAIALIAFGLRLAWRIHRGSDDFWVNGYSFFYDLAKNVAEGSGMHSEGGRWAARAPVYPLFLALTALAGGNYLFIVIPQALIGAGTVLCASFIGRELFDRRVGVIASVLTAFYPYYVVHDTALQDTCIFTFATAMSILLLIWATRGKSVAGWTAAGLSMATAVLTRPTIAPFAAAAVVWIAIAGDGIWRERFARVLTIVLAFSVPVGAWLARNYVVVGAPVLTSELGEQVWTGNSAYTFTYYPVRTIDLSKAAAFRALSSADWRELDGLGRDEVRQSAWFLARALQYIRAHRVEIIRGAGYKVLAGFSWRFNPVRDRVVQTTYLLSYAPISLLGLLGMTLSWRRWREHVLIYLLFLSFVAVTSIFWAHTSHRTYLDLYLIVFASYAVQRFGSSAHHLRSLWPE